MQEDVLVPRMDSVLEDTTEKFHVGMSVGKPGSDRKIQFSRAPPYIYNPEIGCYEYIWTEKEG